MKLKMYISRKIYSLSVMGLLLCGIGVAQVLPLRGPENVEEPIVEGVSDSTVYRVKATVSLANIIEQMNYCYMALTNIINSKSMLQYESELDQLINNLAVENIADIDEIAEFREDLMSVTSDLAINEEERKVLRRLNTIRRDNVKYQAISNALSMPMLLVPGAGGSVASAPQLAFYTLLSAARSAVDYTVQGNQLQAEEIQSFWELRKRDLESFKNLRLEAFRLLVQLYKKYNLKESDRLTERTALLFSNIIQEGDASKRLRLLLDNKQTYASFIDWDYYVGMAYLDIKQNAEACRYLHSYIDRRQATPLFRIDSKLGISALTLLTYDAGLSTGAKMDMLTLAKNNLPENGASLNQIALLYRLLGQSNEGFDLLRRGLDNERTTDKDLLVWTIVQGISVARPDAVSLKTIDRAVKSTSDISLNSYLSYLAASNIGGLPKELSTLISFDKFASRHFWGNGYVWLAGPKLDYDNILLNINSNRYQLDVSDIEVYRMRIGGGSVKIREMVSQYEGAVTREELEDEFDFFKSYPKAIPVLFHPLQDDVSYIVRRNIDFNTLTPGSSLHDKLSVYGELSEDELQDIKEYCEDHQSKAQGIQLKLKDNTRWFGYYLWNSVASPEPMRYLNYDVAKLQRGRPYGPEDLTFEVSLKLNDMSSDSIKMPYKPLVPYGEEGEFIVLKWKGPQDLILTYKYTSNPKKMTLYSMQFENVYGGVLNYKIYDSRVRLDRVDMKETSFFSGVASFFAGVFAGIGSFFAAIWGWIAGLFS